MNEKYTYENYFTPYISNFIKVTICDVERRKLATTIGNAILAKEKLKGRKLLDMEIRDFKKIYMQTAGDLVMGEFLMLNDIVKYDKIFEKKRISFLNNLLSNYSVDIVTFDYGLFPMVFKKTYRKTIFICMLNKKDYYICGIATPELIDKYSSTDLVLSPYFRSKGKSAFYGFQYLIPLSSKINEFIRLIK